MMYVEQRREEGKKLFCFLFLLLLLIAVSLLKIYQLCFLFVHFSSLDEEAGVMVSGQIEEEQS